MKLRSGVLVAAVALLIAVPAATARTGSTADDVTGTVGQAVTLDGELSHTVVQAQRWYGGGFWLPPAGKAAVTVEVKLHALQKTSYNVLYYGLQSSPETEYGRVFIGPRDPSLHSGDLAPGATVDGWITFLVPTTELNGLKLGYHAHAGFGSSLTVPLGKIADSPRVSIGKTAVLAGEQAITATSVERPSSFGMWKPRAGSVFITANVQVRALKATKTGDFSAFTPAGKSLGDVMMGHRTPIFPANDPLGARKVATGWVTLMVPKTQAHGLTLVYHLSGYRDTLLIPLPG